MKQLVRDIMFTDPVTISTDATIGDAVDLFSHKQVGSLMVVDGEGRLMGFLSDGDIIDYVVRNVRKKNRQLNHVRSWYQVDCFHQYLKSCVSDSIQNAYTERPYTVEANDSVREAARLINRKHLRHLPVIDKGQLVGFITRKSIINGLFSDYLDNPDAPCVEDGQEDDF